MSYGFSVTTGTGSTVVYDGNSPAPGYVLHTFSLGAGGSYSNTFTGYGVTELIVYAYGYINPSVASDRGFPQVYISGLSLTVTNSHPYAANGWGGTIYVIVMGR